MKFILVLLFVVPCIVSGESKYLFPWDLSQWTCLGYINQIKNTKTYKTLQKLLKKRSHKFYKSASLSDLKLIPTKYTVKYPYHKIRIDAYSSLVRMIQDSHDKGSPLYVSSAYRSPYLQNLLWKNRLNAEYDVSMDALSNYVRTAYKTAPPCYSEHATGLAVDFLKTNNWLRDNAKKYGWKQSFDGSGDVTNIMKESWHYAYIKEKS